MLFLKQLISNSLSIHIDCKFFIGVKIYCIICILYLSFCSIFPIYAKTKSVEISNDFSFYINSLSGNGASTSAYDKGLLFQDIMTIYGEGNYKNNSYSYNLSLLGTNDQSIDQKLFIFNSISAQLKNKKRVINIGDVFNSYSQYSLSSPFKGFSYKTITDNQKTIYIFSAGIIHSRWDRILVKDDLSRKVIGAKVENIKATRDLKISFNSVVVRDDNQKSKNQSKYETQVISSNWKYHPIRGLDITGESAFSGGTMYSPTGQKISTSSAAHKVRMVGDGQGLRGVIEIELVGGKFDNPVGGAVKDRLKYKTSWRYKKNRLLWYQFGLLWFRNNLDSQLGSTTESLRPSFKISKKRVFKRRYSKMAFNYNLTRRKNSASEQKNHYLALSYNDRFNKIYRFNSNIGYNLFNTKNKITDQKQLMFDFGLSTRKSFKNYSLKPFFKFARWITEDDLSLSTDKSTNYSLGSAISLFKYDLDATLSLGKYGLDREKGDNSDRVFMSLDVNYTPKFLAKLWKSSMISSISYNKYSFTDDSQNFKEARFLIGIQSRL